jgi:hypothetical protein
MNWTTVQSQARAGLRLPERDGRTRLFGMVVLLENY